METTKKEKTLSSWLTAKQSWLDNSETLNVKANEPE